MSEAPLTTSFFLKKGQIDQFGYKITLIKNTNNSSTVVGLTTYVRHFKLFESIFSKFMYVEGLLVDGGGIVQRMGIQPGDIMLIDLYKDPSDTEDLKISKEFIIEQIGGQARTDGNKVTRYPFRAVSKIGFEGLKNKVKKSFNGPADKVVAKISDYYLKAEPKLTKNFTSTFGDIKYIASSATPFDTIENISKQCISASNPKDGNFFFYETRDSLVFRSLRDIVASGNTYPYILAVNKNRSETSLANDYFRIQDFTHHESTDQRAKIQQGALKNKTVLFDFISRKVTETTFDVKRDYRDVLLMGDNLAMDDEEIGNYVDDDKRSTDEEQSLFIRCSNESYDQPQDYIGSIKSYAQAQRALMNQTVLTVTIHGNPRLKPGDTIELEMNQSSAEYKQEKDIFLTGKFLVGSCAHSVTDADRYVTICDIFKDGYERSINDYRKDINNHFIKPRE